LREGGSGEGGRWGEPRALGGAAESRDCLEEEGEESAEESAEEREESVYRIDS
jgi:hypothetical protein